MAKKAKDLKDELLRRSSRERRELGSLSLLSTGSTLFNLACSGRITGGIPTGTILHLPGDSDSGKTVEALTIAAEAARNPKFDDYDLRFWNSEDGSLMETGSFFGKKLRSRLVETRPEMLEEWYYELDDLLNSGKPFVGVLDSMDVLYPKAWYKKFKKAKAAAKREIEESGDYGTQKAKINSENLRRVRSQIIKSGSILIIISQTRDNPAARYGDKKTVAGGRVLKFYSTMQVWFSTYKTVRKSVRGQQRPIGIVSQADVRKNHLNGNKRKILIPILNELGVDDTTSCIQFLIDEGHWKKKGQSEEAKKVIAPEFYEDTVKGISIDKLARLIEENDQERQLRKLVKEVWTEIEEGCRSGRRRRYE